MAKRRQRQDLSRTSFRVLNPQESVVHGITVSSGVSACLSSYLPKSRIQREPAECHGSVVHCELLYHPPYQRFKGRPHALNSIWASVVVAVPEAYP